jgi:glycosyltransferase involved in cell wall biosynthesis
LSLPKQHRGGENHTTIKDHTEEPDLSSGSRKENGNGNGNGNGTGNGHGSHHLISLINHYSAFNETIKANSATAVIHYTPQALPRMHSPNELTDTVYSPLTTTTPDTPKSDLIVAVIPAFNEEISIGSVILQTREHVDCVIVVDDGSADATSLIARAAGADVITLPKNGGKAAAMMRGFERALDLDPDVVVMLDADGQHNASEIPSLVKPVLAGQADLVIGSRFLIDGNSIPRYRQLGQKTLNLATQAGSGFASTDSQSGFRAISKKGLENLTFTSEGYNIESDMITHFIEKGLEITEVPVTVKYDVPNKHKKNPVEHGMDIMGHLIGLVGYKRPLLYFGVPGLGLIGGGLFFGSWAFSYYYATAKFPFSLSMLSTLLLIMGMLLVTSGFILNSLVQIVSFERRS